MIASDALLPCDVLTDSIVVAFQAELAGSAMPGGLSGRGLG
jgi:hypothetical protein